MEGEGTVTANGNKISLRVMIYSCTTLLCQKPLNFKKLNFEICKSYFNTLLLRESTFENPLYWQLNIVYVIPEYATLCSNMHISVYNVYSNIKCAMMCTNIRDSFVVVSFCDYIVTIDEAHKSSLHINASPL